MRPYAASDERNATYEGPNLSAIGKIQSMSTLNRHPYSFGPLLRRPLDWVKAIGDGTDSIILHF